MANPVHSCSPALLTFALLSAITAAIVYRPAREARSFSPAALRIAVRASVLGTGLTLDILKSRGGHATVTKLRTGTERA